MRHPILHDLDPITSTFHIGKRKRTIEVHVTDQYDTYISITKIKHTSAPTGTILFVGCKKASHVLADCSICSLASLQLFGRVPDSVFLPDNAKGNIFVRGVSLPGLGTWELYH